MNEFDVYQKYCAIKAHFNSPTYDYVKYRGRSLASEDAYQKRYDKNFFVKVSKRYKDDEIVPFFIANFISNENIWIGDLVNNIDAEKVYSEWSKRIEGLTYYFEIDFRSIVDFTLKNDLRFSDLFRVKAGEHPPLFKLLLQGEISLESFIIMDSVFGFIQAFDQKMSGDLIWEQWSFKCKKYSSFLKIDKNKFKKIMKTIINI